MTVKKAQGFTLLEVLIVLVIVAVMAGLAVPGYISTVEKSRKQEALATLGAIRSSEQRFFATGGAYTAVIASLDFDPTVVAGGVVAHYTYGIAGGGAAFTATATRNAADFSASSGCPAAYTVTINQAGTVVAGC